MGCSVSSLVGVAFSFFYSFAEARMRDYGALGFWMDLGFWGELGFGVDGWRRRMGWVGFGRGEKKNGRVSRQAHSKSHSLNSFK